MPAQYLYEVEEGDPPPLTDDQPAGLLQESESQPDEADDVEAIAETEEAEPDEGEVEPEGKAGVLTVAEAADILLHSPQRINELKGSERAAAIKASHERLTATHQAQTNSLLEQAYQQGMQNGYATARDVVEFEQLSALDPYEREAEFATDPKRKLKFARMLSAQLGGELEPQQRPATSVDSPQVWITRAQQKFAEVRGEPFAADLIRNNDAKKYPENIDGYEALIADIAAFRAKPAKPAAPPPEAAAAARLKAGPKSTSSAGTAAPGQLTRERLAAMSEAEVDRLMATPEGEAQIDRVMAMPRRR